jgi:hypothetical protein
MLSGCIRLVCCLSLCSVSPVYADYLARSSAMKAPTIAQYYIDSEGVRLELDIDPADLPAFGDLLPDALREKMQLPVIPFEERFNTFIQRGLPLLDEHGQPLPGRLLSMKPEPRVERDPITGAPMAVDDGTPVVHILRVAIAYPFADDVLPKKLVFGGVNLVPRPVIGFVAYHNSVAINEFRYLGNPVVLHLDWGDPWYSEFSNRTMRRTYYSSMNGFVYVEPYEVRKEIIVRPKDMQRWVDLGLADATEITPAMYPQIKQRLGEFLDQHLATSIDGEPARGELISVNFLDRKLTSSRVIDPPETLALDSAVMGAIWVYPTLGLPQRVDVEWDLFDDKITQVSAATVDQAGPLPVMLEPDFKLLTWQNFLQQPHVPTLVKLMPPPGPGQRLAQSGRWVLLALLVSALLWSLWVWWRLRGRAREALGWPLAAMALLLPATLVLFIIAQQRPMNSQVAESLVADLLHNIYRAFDFRQDEQIYDVLAQSVSGDLLTRIYLETKQGLVLQNQGGARAKVKDIELHEIAMVDYQRGALTVNADWTVNGAVGHWGHIHQRANRYRALLTLAPEDGRWTLQAIEVLQEERVK